MKRSWVGAGLLVLLLIFSLLGGWVLDRCAEPVTRKLEEAGVCALSGNWGEARNLARGAMDHWEGCRGILAALGNQGAMEKVDGLFARLEVYLRTRDPQTAPSCAEAARLVAGMNFAGNWWDLI